MKNFVFNINSKLCLRRALLEAASGSLLLGGFITVAQATEPCDDFGECKALIEINSSDGDIGFHWLIDGDDLNSVRMDDPNGKKIYQNKAFGPLRDQNLTETFGESAEPVCRESLKESEDDVVVTLEEFLERWTSGPYSVSGSGDGGEKLFGMTELTYEIPAAPQDLEITGGSVVIEWADGEDLGECATKAELDDLVNDGILPIHPEDVTVDSYEVVMEPDVDEDEPNAAMINSRVFSVRVPGNVTQVTVPQEYLLALGDETPVKFEVGAIGGEDNATFTERGDCEVSINGDEATVECEDED